MSSSSMSSMSGISGMNTKYDAVIIGGGHNGLICAAYLAKAGRKVLVLERRHLLGTKFMDDLFP